MIKLLLVDDEKDILQDLSDALTPTGYDIVCIDDPLKALELYKKDNFDAVISDVRMPNMTGIELLKKIRENDSKAKVLILTAYGDLETAMMAINNHAFAFFAKPVNIVELINTLKKIEEELKGLGDKLENYKELKSKYEELKSTYKSLLELIKTKES